MSSRVRRILAAVFVIVGALVIGRELFVAFVPAPGAEECARVAQEVRLNPPKEGRAFAIARACAPLFREPKCREAHQKFEGANAHERAYRLAEACRTSYCGVLPEPKPDLCAKLPETPPELARQWTAFVPVVLRHDHGSRANVAIEALTAPVDPAR